MNFFTTSCIYDRKTDFMSVSFLLFLQLDCSRRLEGRVREMECVVERERRTREGVEGRVRELEGELEGERERSTTLEEQLNAMKEKHNKVRSSECTCDDFLSIVIM